MPPLATIAASWHRGGALAAAVLLAACAVNPATGERQFTGLLPSGQEAELGASEHPKVVAQFGGAYKDPELTALVGRVGARLAAVTERPQGPWTFTVLDSDVVNAFALPGGYVYLTRGLLALAEDEAEVAGVMAHEMGHVTGRHTAERMSQSTVAGVLTAGLGAVLGSPVLAQALNLGSEAALAGYSRGQELEADGLGVRYLAAAGYDPRAMASFLETMRRFDQYQSQVAGREGSGFDFFATHPRTEERVQQAADLAGKQTPGAGERPVQPYLAAIDGVVWGDSPEQGLVRGRAFVHPVLGFRFEVPEGYTLLNGTQQVIGRGGAGTALIFDTAPAGGTADPAEHISGTWAAGAPLSGLESVTINGMPAATAVTSGRTDEGAVDVRLVAIRMAPDRFDRFTFVAPEDGLSRVDAQFRQIASSFRRITAQEAAGFRPRRVQVVTAGPNDTPATMAARMAQEPRGEDLFRIINDLPPGTPLPAGRPVKIVAPAG